MPSKACLDQLVAAHFPGATVSAIKALTGGVSADVHRLDLTLADGSSRAIVLREHGPTLDGHELSLEFATLKALHKAGVAVPEPLTCDASGSLLAQPWLLMEFICGSTQIPSRQIDGRIHKMAKHMAGLHKTSLGRFPELAMTLDPLPELREWIARDNQWRDLAPLLGGVLDGLDDTAYRGEPVLLHGDFWPGNIVWDEAGNIAAVLDWEDASLGDPLFDVACTCLELRYIYAKHTADQFRAAYAKLCELDPFRFALWQAYAGIWEFQNMGNWRLEPEREAQMRRESIESVREAAMALSQ